MQFMLHILEGDFHALGGDFQVSIADNHETGFSLRLLRELPEALLWEVLQRLPYSSKLRFATVSKSWHSRLLSKENLRSTVASALPSPSPMVCCLDFIEDSDTDSHTEIVHGDGSSRSKVYELDLSFLPEDCLDWFQYWYEIFVQEGLMGIVADRWVTKESLRSSVEVCLWNPMTRTWRLIPRLSLEDEISDERQLWNIVYKGQKWRVKLQLDRSSVSSGKVQFELILLLPGSTRTTDMDISVSQICRYSSITDKWTVTKFDDQRVHESDSRALCGEFIYTVRHQSFMEHSLQEGKFCGEYAMPTLPTERHLGLHLHTCCCDRSQLLVEHQGDLLCVQHISSRVEECPTFGIWKLDRSSMRWSKLTTTPRMVVDQFRAPIPRDKKLFYSGKASTVGEVVCLNIYHVGHAPSLAPSLVHVVMCHIPTKMWYISFNNLMTVRLDFLQPHLDIFL